MADTPTSDQPKRRRTTKTATGAKPARAPRQTKVAAAPAAETKSAAAAPAPAPAESRAKAPTAPAKTRTKTVKAPPARKTASAPRSTVAKSRTAPRRSVGRPAASPRKQAAPSPARTPAAAPVISLPEIPPRAGVFAALGTLAAIGGAFFVWRATRADEPAYQTVESDGPIEVRKYPAMVTAGTKARGTRQAALNDGFRTLADYLFAKSRRGPKISMTAPVLSDANGDGTWRTRFIMPGGKARAELPAAPDGVELVSEPAARIAAMRFSGRVDDATLDAKEGALRSWLQIRGLPSEGKAVHAFYNAPIIPGPFRRNEVLIVLSDEGGTRA